MKLIGSKLEQDYRAELIHSNEGLLSSESSLGNILRKNGYNTQKAYVLHWMPDEAEDIYTVLIDGKYFITIEIDRKKNSMVSPIERIALKDYLFGLSQINQIQLLVAQDLTNEKI